MRFNSRRNYMLKPGICAGMTAVAAIVLSSGTVSAQTITVDQKMLQQLQDTIRQQQQQLQQQSDQIRAQADILQKLQQQVNSIQKAPLAQTAAQPAATGAQLQTAATAVTPEAPLPSVVTSGNDKIKLSISGTIDRAVNVIGDGGRTKLYHVDNDADNTKVRFEGTARINEDMTVGTKLEVAITADESSQVSQLNQAPGNFLDARWAEVYLESKKFGKLSLGKGETASASTATVDLSKTDVVLYSSVSDIAGGIFFREKDGLLSVTTVANAFNAGDGGRHSRVRYDTPDIFGFSLAGSVFSNERSDIALRWGGEGYGFQGAGAFAVANTKVDDERLQYDGSFSLLHTATGLNLTVAGALMDRKVAKDGTNLYGKLGWLANFTSLGYTAFGVDYTNSRDMAADGDKGYSVGGAVVQAFEKYATEVYLQYRLFSLNRTQATPVNNINMGTFGVRVKF